MLLAYYHYDVLGALTAPAVRHSKNHCKLHGDLPKGPAQALGIPYAVLAVWVLTLGVKGFVHAIAATAWA